MASGVFSIVSDYLLSNNHINSIIVHKFDFSDEEVCTLFFMNDSSLVA